MEILTVERLGLLLGLSFFFGLSFEGFYWNCALSRPGGIRTFPLLSLSGALLYGLEPMFASAFCVGLIVLGVWLYPYYRAEVARGQAGREAPDGLMVPICNLAAPLLVLSLAGGAAAILCLRLGRAFPDGQAVAVPKPGNPLELTSAVVLPGSSLPSRSSRRGWQRGSAARASTSWPQSSA